MKILLITWACDRDDVSEPEIAYRWVREISKRHEVTLFAVSRPDRYGCVQEQFSNISVIEWKDINVPSRLERFRAIAKPGYFFYFNKARKKIKELISEKHFDVIHHLSPFSWRYASPGYGLNVPLVRGPVAGGLQTPEVLNNQIYKKFSLFDILRKADYFRRAFDKNLINTYKYADLVLLAAPYVLDFLKKYKVIRYEIEIEHGIGGKVFFNRKLNKTNKDKIIILFVGRIIETKGVREAIKAIFYMKNKNMVQLRIIGDGPDLYNCKKIVKYLNLDDVVLFKGWCDKNKIDTEYLNADIFLFPSFREPTGGVILEAMTRGLPCVVCDYGGPRYMINKECGILISPSSHDEYSKEIAASLDLLVGNPELRFEFGEKAFSYAMCNFDWDSKMDRLDCYYHSLVKK